MKLDADFRWYLSARLTNLAGTAMAGVALAFAVLEIGGSATALGQVLAAHTVPLLLVLLWGGVLADRLPRRLLIQASSLGAAGAQGVLAVLVLTGVAELWMVIGLSAANGVLAAISYPALSGIVPQLVSPGQLQRANAVLSFGGASVRVLAPTAAGLMMAVLGSGWALAADAAAWLVSAALLTPVTLPPAAPGRSTDSVAAELRAGWAYVRETGWFRIVVAVFATLNMLYYGAIHTLGPAVARTTVGLDGWGFVLSAQAVGLLGMSLVLMRVRLHRPLRAGMVGISLLGLPIFLLGAHPTLPVLMLGMAVAGAGVEVFNLGWNLAMQEHTPQEMLSRASSYDLLGSYAAMPIGQLAFGPLGATLGVDKLLVVTGVAYVVIALLTLSSGAVRNLRRTSSPDPGRPDGG